MGVFDAIGKVLTRGRSKPKPQKKPTSPNVTLNKFGQPISQSPDPFVQRGLITPKQSPLTITTRKSSGGGGSSSSSSQQVSPQEEVMSVAPTQTTVQENEVAKEKYVKSISAVEPTFEQRVLTGAKNIVNAPKEYITSLENKRAEELYGNQFEDAPSQVYGGTRQTQNVSRLSNAKIAELAARGDTAALKAYQKRLQDNLDRDIQNSINALQESKYNIYYEKLNQKHNELQTRINNGEITKKEAETQLKNYISKINEEYKRDIETIARREIIPNYEQSYQEEFKKVEKKAKFAQAIQFSAISIPIGFVAGAGFGAAAAGGTVARTTGAAVQAGAGLLFAKETSDLAQGLGARTKDVGDVAIFGGGLVGFGVGGAIGAKIGNKVIASSVVDTALDRAIVKSNIKAIKNEGQLNAFAINKDFKGTIKKLLNEGNSVSLIETTLKAGNAKDAKVLPNIKGYSIEVTNRQGQVIDRVNLGEYVGERKGTKFSREVISKGVGTINENRAQTFRDVNVVIDKSLVGNKQKIIKVEAYKTLEETEPQLVVKDAKGNRFVKTKTRFTKVGESIFPKKVPDIEKLEFYPKAEQGFELLGESKTTTISAPTGKKVAKAKGYVKEEGILGTGYNVNQFYERGFSIFEKAKKQKSKPTKTSLSNTFKEEPPTSTKLVDFGKIKNRFNNRGGGNKASGQKSLLKRENILETKQPTQDTTTTGTREAFQAGDLAREVALNLKKQSIKFSPTSSQLIYSKYPNIGDLIQNKDRTKTITSPRLSPFELTGQSTRQVQSPRLISQQGLNLRQSSFTSSFVSSPSGFKKPASKPPSFLFSGGLDGRSSLFGSRSRGTNKGQATRGYQAGFGSVALGLKRKVSKKEAKLLSRKRFTGLEIRPELEIK